MLTDGYTECGAYTVNCYLLLEKGNHHTYTNMDTWREYAKWFFWQEVPSNQIHKDRILRATDGENRNFMFNMFRHLVGEDYNVNKCLIWMPQTL